jgi:hypothetical protein
MGLEGKVWGLAKWVHSLERSLSASSIFKLVHGHRRLKG